MKNETLSVSGIMEAALKKMDHKGIRIFCASLLYFLVYLVTNLLTGSMLVSALVYAVFFGGFISYMVKLANDKDPKVEEIFYLNKKSLSMILTMALFVTLTAIGMGLLVVPGFLFLINFGFAPFAYVEDPSRSAFDYYRQAHEEVKGYRSKLLWLSLIFFFILVLFSGVGILIVFLGNLIFPLWLMPLWFGGIGIGISLFALVILPMLVITVNDFRLAVLKDKETKRTEEVAKELHDSEPKEAEEDAVEKIDGETSEKVEIKDAKK